MGNHEQELYNHFVNTLRLPKDEAVYKTREVIAMEVNLDKVCMQMKNGKR